ncbi:hypothetical protein FD684_10970, partial [Neisseria meningitidis]
LVIPAQAGIRFFKLRFFPINCFSFSFPDSRFCGNDDGRLLLFRINYPNFKIPDSHLRGNNNIFYFSPSFAGDFIESLYFNISNNAQKHSACLCC